MEGGWRILNHWKYRLKMSPEDIRERNRIRQQRHREREKARHTESVTEGDNRDMSQTSRQAEVDPNSKKQEKTFAHPKDEPVKPASLNAPNLRTRTAKVAVLAAGLYGIYPRKIAKQSALKAIAEAITSVAERGSTDKHGDFGGDIDAAFQWLKSRTTIYANSPQGKREDRSFIPHPATWYTQGRFDDTEAEWNYAGWLPADKEELKCKTMAPSSTPKYVPKETDEECEGRLKAAARSRMEAAAKRKAVASS